MRVLFPHAPIRRKVIGIVVLITALVLSITAAIVMVSDIRIMRQALVEHVTVLARLASVNSGAALAFQDPETAEEILSAMSGEPEILGIHIRTLDHRSFTGYNTDKPQWRELLDQAEADELAEWKERGHEMLPAGPPRIEFRDGYVDVDHAITINGRNLGYIDIQYATVALEQRIRQRIGIILGVLAAGILLAYLLASRLHRIISVPITHLADSMAGIAESRDYTVRVEGGGKDEVGVLIQAFNDMLEQIQTSDADLSKAKEAAEAGSKAKSQFLAAMSHEIRTPMNGVFGMTELLMRTPLNHRQSKFTLNIQRSAQSLLNIINDILDFSKIEANKLELEQIDFDLREIVEGTAELLAESAHRKGLNLIVSIPPEIATGVRGDPGRLQQVLTNLLSNAVKFTEQGHVGIHIEGRPHGNGQLRVDMVVTDTGIGLSEREQERVFERFSQADASSTRRYGGTGLGLAISQQLVRLMGGELSVQSTLGEGSEFRLSLPLQLQLQQAPTQADDTQFAGRKVLLAEPNAMARLALERQLRFWLMSVESTDAAGTAAERVEAASRAGDPFDVILIGEELVSAEFRVGPLALDTLPVLIMRRSESEDRLQIQWPTSMCLFKPLRQSILAQRLKQVLSGEKRLPPDPAQTTPTALSGVAESTGLTILVVEDNPVNQAVVEEMLYVLGYAVKICADGQAALDLLQRESVDLVLMDCQMPVLDGYETTKRLRSLEAEQGAVGRLPIIALTAHAMADDQERALQAGMDDYMKKPFQLEELRTILDRWRPVDS